MQAALPIAHAQNRKTSWHIRFCYAWEKVRRWFRCVIAYSRTKMFIEAIAGSGKLYAVRGGARALQFNSHITLS
jgi:hypothetical protein